LRNYLLHIALARTRPVMLLVVCFSVVASCAAQDSRKAPPVPGPMLEQGFLTLKSPEFAVTLVKSSQTMAALKPKGAEGFDFTPGDMLVERSQDGYYHLGDLDLRLRSDEDGPWKSYSTAYARHPVTPLPTSGEVLAAADLAPTLPPDIPLQIVRAWTVTGGRLGLRFTITNKSSRPVEIGSLGIPMIFNNVVSGRTLDQAHEACSFYDPYIGEDGGYLQVTRLNGRGPALVVVPEGRTPFEAYNPILNKRGPDRKIEIFNDPTPRSMTFEGFYDWMVHSGAYQQSEWKQAQPWNPATTFTLEPGASRVYGVKFLVSDSIRNIEKTLAANHRPVAVGVPGYILPVDIDGHLFLNYPKKVKSITVEPAGAIRFAKDKSSPTGWQNYLLNGKTWGRARVSITYQDGLLQTINYMVIKPEADAVADLGHFLTTKEWFVDPKDPFKRSPSPMSYDREANHIVTQESRVWIAGLSDEGGAGPWLAAAMKELGQPNKEEIEKYEQFVDKVLWGGLQTKDGPGQYGVRKSLFYYQPDKLPPGYYQRDLNWKSWTSWNQKQSEALDRSFNYPHVAAAYWVLYRLSRNNPGLVTNHPWQWYLDHAYETIMAMMKDAGYYTRFGQMEGDVFVNILEDLKREGMTENAYSLEAAMRGRADRWNKEAYPFGSEMPWDSTGQEEVYAWTKYFGYKEKAEVTLNAILGYDPTIPSWGYNGSARRYWDFLYGGKHARLERQLHHYGSGINAIPLLAEYRDHPDDLYLLRVGYGGTMGELSNIDQEGFASAAFHSFPDKLAFDPYTGDYGSGFFGHAFNTATYLTQDPQLGWLAFGGNIQKKGKTVSVTLLDSFRNRLYIAPLGLWLTLDAGKFEWAEFNSETRTVKLILAGATEFTPEARLRIEQPAKLAGIGTYGPVQSLKSERGAYVVPLGHASSEVVLQQNRVVP
jgi:hypothetical protein